MRRNKNAIPIIIQLMFCIAMVLFVAQPLAPEVISQPIQIWIVTVVFIWFSIVKPKRIKRALNVFTKTQKVAIVIILIVSFGKGLVQHSQILRFYQVVVGVMVAIVGALFYNDPKSRKIILTVTMYAAVASSMAAILQYVTPWKWLWAFARYNEYGYGSTGLENNPVAFSYSIIGPVTLTFGVLVIQTFSKQKLLSLPWYLMLFNVIVITLGMMFSRNRSGIVGLLLGVSIVIVKNDMITNVLTINVVKNKLIKIIRDVTYTITKKAKKRSKLLGLLAVVSMVIVAVSVVKTRNTQGKLVEDERFVGTWVMYLPVIYKNIFGVENEGAIFDALAKSHGSDTTLDGLKVIYPHNIILTTGVMYGPFGILAIVMLYFSGIRKVLAHLNKKNIKYVSIHTIWMIIMASVNISILVHCWFHNANIFIGEMRNWLWLGIMMASERMCSKNEKVYRQ